MGFLTKAKRTSQTWRVGINVRWYLNDASLQGQFHDREHFEHLLKGLIEVRARIPAIRNNFRSTRSFPDANIGHSLSVRQAVMTLRDRDLKAAALVWFDRTGPFVDDDRLTEADDYFEYRTLDVTNTGLGEATRRTMVNVNCATFSFAGGEVDFAVDPLEIEHGLPEDRLGRYPVPNCWVVRDLGQQALDLDPPPHSWATLFDAARKRFPNLEIGALEADPRLSREPFEASIRDRALELLSILNDYVSDRGERGEEGAAARRIIETYFVGDDNAAFTGESSTNRKDFKSELTFKRTGSGDEYVAHWHGKIKHRFFRMHFEWPLEGNRKKLEIFYLGPKLTKG